MTIGIDVREDGQAWRPDCGVPGFFEWEWGGRSALLRSSCVFQRSAWFYFVHACTRARGRSNVQPLVERVRDVFKQLPEYDYEHIIIDNASTDSTVEELRVLAAADPGRSRHQYPPLG